LASPSLPNPCPPAVPQARDQEFFPPGLRIAPIRNAAAPPDRKLTQFLTALTYVLLLVVGPYLMGVIGNSSRRPLPARFQVARLLLDEAVTWESAPQAGGNNSPGGQSLDNPNPREAGIDSAPVSRLDIPASLFDPLLGPETLREAAKIPAGTLEPAVAGRISGVGSGRGGATGNGLGLGASGSRGTARIHLGQGTEEIQLVGNSLEYQDYIPPVYPEAARLDRISGDVVVQVSIDEAGHPTKWKALEGHPLLVKASLKVLPMWNFLPITHKGKKVRATIELTIRFTLI
jgi:TonB family protein